MGTLLQQKRTCFGNKTRTTLHNTKLETQWVPSKLTVPKPTVSPGSGACAEGNWALASKTGKNGGSTGKKRGEPGENGGERMEGGGRYCKAEQCSNKLGFHACVLPIVNYAN